MASEEKIVNKIIPKETILEVASYLENLKNEYQKKFDEDEEKNSSLSYKEKVYEYNGTTCKVEYNIKFKNGKDITEKEYTWFEKNLITPKKIEKAEIHLSISYSSNTKNKDEYEYKHIYAWINFREEYTSISIDGKNIEEEVHKIHSYIRGIIENNEDRYNKTVKNRDIRIQSFCFSIGFILSYFIYLVLLFNKANIPTEFIGYFDNKYILVIGQWLVAAIVGNLFGYPIMMTFYKNILPNKKYSHYNSSSRKTVYVDNIDEYMSYNEVQIGKFAENGKNRELIEKIYKISIKIILVQIVLSILFFLILK